MVALADEKLVRSQEVAGKMKVLADRLEEARKAGKTWAEADEKEFNGLSAEYDSLKKEIDEARSANTVQERMRQIDEDQKRSIRHGKAKPGLDDRIPGEDRTYGDAGYDRDEARNFAQSEIDKRNALRAWMVSEFAPELVDRRMQEDAAKLGVNLNSKQINIRFDSESFKRLQREARRTHPSRLQDDLENRALSKVASPGTELVPQTFIAQIELAMLTYGPLLSYVTTLTTEDGRQIPWPTGDDTGNGGLVAAEATDINAQSQPDPSMATIPLGAFEYTSRFIKVPNVLIRDSMVNIDLLVAGFIGERMGRLFTQDATVGTGTGQMQGIRLASATGATAASATAIAGDDIVNLVHSVDQAYRSNGTFMAHDTIIATVRKLKDTTGQYLWQSNLREGLPDTLLGRPVIPNPNMAATLAATNISVLFGDFSKYMFRRVGTGILYRLQERFVESLQTGYLFHQSADGRLIRANTTTLNPVKRLTH
jgi:HK97 family phage major capsid protein